MDFTAGAVRVKKGMGNFFKGNIKYIAFYGKALSASEIGRLYSLTAPEFKNASAQK